MRKKKKFIKFRYDNCDLIEKHLDDMENKGWSLLKIESGFSSTFTESQNDGRRYKVIPFVKGTMSDGYKVSTNLGLIEHVETKGWKFIAKSGTVNVFFTTDENAEDISVNREELFNEVCTRTPVFLFNIICMFPLLIFSLFNFDLFRLVNDFNYASGAILIAIAMIAVVTHTIRMFLWKQKAKRIFKKENRIIPFTKRITNKAIIVGLLVFGIVFGVAGTCLNVYFGESFYSKIAFYVLAFSIYMVIVFFVEKKYDVFTEKRVPFIIAGYACVMLIFTMLILFAGVGRGDKYEKKPVFDITDYNGFFDLNNKKPKDEQQEHEYVKGFLLSKEKHNVYCKKSKDENYHFNITFYNSKYKFARDIVFNSAVGNDRFSELEGFYNKKTKQLKEYEKEGAKVYFREYDSFYDDDGNKRGYYTYNYLIYSGNSIIDVAGYSELSDNQIRIIIDSVNKF
ncbi:MAG: DUF2812 domain-containing protein [Lachnospiraceae bacterium]|nr:DUF2812 domain-containing protein [Lachnospiraceae bacterium]